MELRGIDLGGSKVRLAQSVSRVMTFDAQMLEIEASLPTKDYMVEDVLSDFVIKQHPMVSLCGRRFVRGANMHNYNGRRIYCDNQTMKVKQEATYINAAYALARDFAIAGVDDAEVKLSGCIPTSEFFSNEMVTDIFKQHLTGTFSILFPLTGKTVTFTIPAGCVSVTPEGVIAALRFKTKTSFREGYSLIVDVGYRSSDLTLLQKMRPMGNSAVSKPKGGINIEAIVGEDLERSGVLCNTEEIATMLSTRYIVRDNLIEDVTSIVEQAGRFPEDVRSALAQTYGNVTNEELDIVMNHYLMNRNGEIKDFSEQVRHAKELFCESLKQDIVSMLAVNMLNIDAINNIVPIGRAFSGDVESPYNMVNILTRVLNSKASWCPVDNYSTANVTELIGAMGAKD